MQCSIYIYSVCIINYSMLIHIKGTRETLIGSSKVPLLITHEVFLASCLLLSHKNRIPQSAYRMSGKCSFIV